MRQKYDYIQDPGHGWLKVPLADLPASFHPTPYSFKDSTYAYLEEGCDYSAFMRLVPAFDVLEVIVRDFNRNRERFPRFQESASTLESAERAWARKGGE